MSRFSQSANNFYSTNSYARPSTGYKPARTRIISTGETAQPNLTPYTSRPQTGIMVRSSSSSFRNTKGKLQLLSDQLTVLLDNCQQTRTNTKELHLQLNLLKEDLNQRGIIPMHADLVQQIKGLEKAIKIRERSDRLKWDALQHVCQGLSRSSKQISALIHEAGKRIEQVENMLGFHGVRDKLKY